MSGCTVPALSKLSGNTEEVGCALNVEPGELVLDQDGVCQRVVGNLVQPHKVLGDGLHDEARECKAEVRDHRDQDEPNCDLLQLQEHKTCVSLLGKAIFKCPMSSTCTRSNGASGHSESTQTSLTGHQENKAAKFC